MVPDVSVLIPTRNRCEMLRRTLPTILHQKFPANRYEVIVAVDGSDDRTADYVRRVHSPCRLRVLELPHGGRASALNAALDEARGSIVLFLDDDLLCSPALVSEHWQARAEDVALLGIVMVADGSAPGAAAEMRRRGLADFFLTQSVDSAPFAVGHANSSVGRARLLAAGGLDGSFVGSCEEVECGFRLWKAGARFRFAPRAIAREIYAPDGVMLAARARAHGANEWRLCLKHPEYRPYSRLQQALRGSLSRQLLRRLAVQCPVNPAALLGPMIGGAERLPYREAAVRLLGARMAVSFFRGAVAEAGSWREMVQYVRSAEVVAQPQSPPKKQPAPEPPRQQERRA